MKDINAAKAAVLAQTPRFAIAANPDTNPIAVEASLDEVVAEIKKRLKQGLSFHPPVRAVAGDRFTGMELVVTDPQPPPQIQMKLKTHLVVHIYPDLEDAGAQADGNYLGYAIQAIVVAEFIADANAEQAKKNEEAAAKAKDAAAAAGDKNPTEAPAPAADSKVEALPGAAAEPVRQPGEGSN